MASTEYAPGTVAEIRWTMTSGAERAIYNGESWMTESGIDVHAGRITDVRPLVVLDLEAADQIDRLCKALVESMHAAGDRFSAANGVHPATVVAALNSLTKPPRIPEPGLWGVVCAREENAVTEYDWVHLPTGAWASLGGSRLSTWSNLVDPTLIRDGVES